MTQKDLAEEYANERLQGRLSGNEILFSDNIVFTEDDIKAAFNAGRESVVENIPELEWRNFSTEEVEYYSTSLLGWSYRVMLSFNEFALFCNEHFLKSFLSAKEAKQAANEDYKERIKQALGL